MDLMDDEDLKKRTIDQMMGELDDVTADSLKKPAGPVKGVEIAITVTPKSDEELADEMPEENAETKPEDEEEEEPESSNYISQLLKKLG